MFDFFNFQLANGTSISLCNFSNGSLIQIITLQGRVVKEFNLAYENSILNWDGRGDNGEFLKTGIYLISAYNGRKTNLGKFAVIN